MKERIFATAMQLAADKGIAAVTRNAVADKASVATGSVSYHFDNVKKLQRAVVEQAIRDENLAVLGWAVAEKHPSVQAGKLSEDLRRRALNKHLSR